MINCTFEDGGKANLGRDETIEQATLRELKEETGAAEEKDFAFDHRATILKFFEYYEIKFPLPLFGKL